MHKTYEWNSTNKFPEGLKTGYTTGAGACHSSIFKIENVELLVVFLGGEKTKDYDSRWEEVPKLAVWAFNMLK